MQKIRINKIQRECMNYKILKKAISILTLVTFLFTNMSYGAVESRSLFKNKKVNHQNLSMQNEESLRKRQSVLKGEEDRSEEQKKRPREYFQPTYKISHRYTSPLK